MDPTYVPDDPSTALDPRMRAHIMKHGVDWILETVQQRVDRETKPKPSPERQSHRFCWVLLWLLYVLTLFAIGWLSGVLVPGHRTVHLFRR